MIDWIALGGVAALGVVGLAVVFLPGLNHHMREVLLALSAFCLINAGVRALLIADVTTNQEGRQLVGLSAVVFAVIAVHSLLDAHNEWRQRKGAL